MRSSLIRPLKVALVIGTLLNLINSGDALLHGQWPAHLWKIPLTYIVPFGVSWYAANAEKNPAATHETSPPPHPSRHLRHRLRRTRKRTHRSRV